MTYRLGANFSTLLLITCLGNQQQHYFTTDAFVTTSFRSKLSTSFSVKPNSFPPILFMNYDNDDNCDNYQDTYVHDTGHDNCDSHNEINHEADSKQLLFVDDTNDLILPFNEESTDVVAVVDKEDGVWKARSLLIGAAALYGTNFSLVKLLGDVMPEGVSLSLRFALASLVTLPWLFSEAGAELVDGDVWMATWLGFEVGLWNSVGYISQAVGLETTQASTSAFLCSLAVVTVPLLDFFTGKRIESRQWIGAILAVIGVAVLELNGAGGSGEAVASQSSSFLSTGDLLSLVQPLAFGIGFWKVEKALERYPTEARRLTAAQLLAIFCASVGFGLSSIDASTLQSYPWMDWFTNPSIMFSLFWTGVITSALTIYMENKAMETLSAAEATVIFATEPIWGTAFAAVVMSEQFGMNSAVGAAFIMSACFYSNLGKDGITGAAKSLNENARQVPAKVQNQWVSFATSVAASWASWNVVAASAAEDLPEYEGLDQLDHMIKELVFNILDNLPP